MTLEDEIHQLVRSMDGVATVYAADPMWLTAVKALGSLWGSGGEGAAVPFVVCTEDADPGDASGEEADDGASTAAAAGTTAAGAAHGATRQVMTVKVRIGTDGSRPAPEMARAVAARIRTLVSERRPGLDVKAVVEVSAIGV